MIMIITSFVTIIIISSIIIVFIIFTIIILIIVFPDHCVEAIKLGEAAENEDGDRSLPTLSSSVSAVPQEEAHDALDHLDLQWYCEEQTIAAAFSRFDKRPGNQSWRDCVVRFLQSSSRHSIHCRSGLHTFANLVRGSISQATLYPCNAATLLFSWQEW